MLLAVTALGGTGVLVPQSASAVDFGSVSVYFQETGHHLEGDFLRAWQANGGLMTFGYPLSDPITEDGRIVQYFERARFERHDQHAGTQYVVQATLLGNWLVEDRRNEEPFRPLPPSTADGDNEHRRYFGETGHVLAYGFKTYWEQNGGLYVFGYPISAEFSEKNRDTGEVYTVQYFERARFEWHPEHRGTQYEVLLGRLGAQFAAERKIDISPVTQKPGTVAAFPGLLDTGWSKAIRLGDGSVMGEVIGGALNIRSEPSLSAAIVGATYSRYPVTIYDIVPGEAVDGVPVWYKIGEGRYIAAAWVKPLVPVPPPQTYSGNWVDVNLSTFHAVAYEGERPIYAAIITAGRGDRTPPGVYQIFQRVRYETMDSATVGFPPGHPEHYYLENVEFTQYFKADGFAIHGNYWTAPGGFGVFSSNGCIGMMNHDAEWFWNFLGIGSVVAIHY